MLNNTILLVDDTEDDVLLFRRALQVVGYAGALVVFDSVTEASIYLKREGPHQVAKRPDIIVSDTVLDRESGLDLLEWVRVHPRFQNIPFIMLTGNANPAIVQRATQLGVTSVYQKPATFESLVQTARRIVESIDGRSDGME